MGKREKDGNMAPGMNDSSTLDWIVLVYTYIYVYLHIYIYIYVYIYIYLIIFVYSEYLVGFEV